MGPFLGAEPGQPTKTRVAKKAPVTLSYFEYRMAERRLLLRRRLRNGTIFSGGAGNRTHRGDLFSRQTVGVRAQVRESRPYPHGYPRTHVAKRSGVSARERFPPSLCLVRLC